ncbi:MAG: uncharacterized protein A8A55_1783 [Amphiamblys sp. WSBS2006]|nr:MAG: uncharacterized protein A8A55_1783 [Amphiamblys sp. WSBS2006]
MLAVFLFLCCVCACELESVFVGASGDRLFRWCEIKNNRTFSLKDSDCTDALDLFVLVTQHGIVDAEISCCCFSNEIPQTQCSSVSGPEGVYLSVFQKKEHRQKWPETIRILSSLFGLFLQEEMLFENVFEDEKRKKEEEHNTELHHHFLSKPKDRLNSETRRRMVFMLVGREREVFKKIAGLERNSRNECVVFRFGVEKEALWSRNKYSVVEDRQSWERNSAQWPVLDGSIAETIQEKTLLESETGWKIGVSEAETRPDVSVEKRYKQKTRGGGLIVITMKNRNSRPEHVRWVEKAPINTRVYTRTLLIKINGRKEKCGTKLFAEKEDLLLSAFSIPPDGTVTISFCFANLMLPKRKNTANNRQTFSTTVKTEGAVFGARHIYILPAQVDRTMVFNLMAISSNFAAYLFVFLFSVSVGRKQEDGFVVKRIKQGAVWIGGKMKQRR